MTTTTQTPGHDRGRPQAADHPDDPRLRRHPGAADAGPHRSRAVRPLGRAGRDGAPRSSTGTPATAAAGATSPGATARSTASTAASTRSARTASCRPSPSRAARGRGPRDAAVRGPRRRPHPAARPVAVDSFEGRDQWLASGMETGVERGLRQARPLLDRGRAVTGIPAGPGRRGTGASPARSPTASPLARAMGRAGAGGRLGRPRRRRPPRRVVPGLPRRRQRHHAAGGSVGRRRPGRRLAHQTDAVQALLDDPAPRTGSSPSRTSATMPLGQAIDMIYTGDVFMHTWDLARATGQDETLDPTSAPSCSRACCRWTRCCARPASTGRGCRCPTTPTRRTGCSASSAATRPGGLDLRRSGRRPPGAG